MKRLFCRFQTNQSNQFLYHHEGEPAAKPQSEDEREAARAREAIRSSSDPYEVQYKKEGYTEITGATLVLGDESSAGLRMGLGTREKPDLGKGRIWCSGRKEITAQGTTTQGFIEKMQKELGLSIKAYSNAIIQLGKHDILTTSDPADKIYERLQKIWKFCDKYHMNVYASTIPPIEGATPEQEQRRQELNALIRKTDDPVFRVIDLEGVGDGAKDKETNDRVAIAYLESLMTGGRDSAKVGRDNPKDPDTRNTQDPAFMIPPQNTSYVALGDNYMTAFAKSLAGKKRGEYIVETPPITPDAPAPTPRTPGENTAKMAEKLEAEIIPSLAKMKGYRATVIQASMADVLAPLDSEQAMAQTQDAITQNLKRMYRDCLENNPPVMVIAVTMLPIQEQLEKLYPGEENRAKRERHLTLWRNINEFIINESTRLGRNPARGGRYKRILAVRAHEAVGTRLGYTKEDYKSPAGGLNQEGARVVATLIHYNINQMQVGIDFGKAFAGWKGPDVFPDDQG